jgi:hypothetical protein
MKALIARIRRMLSNREPDTSVRTWEELSHFEKTCVIACINEARDRNGHYEFTASDNQNYYAYPYQGFFSWGINGGRYGWCIARGIRS